MAMNPTFSLFLLKSADCKNNLCHQKKKGRWFWEGISNILNTHSTWFIENVQRIERKLQQILFQNLNPFKLGPQGIRIERKLQQILFQNLNPFKLGPQGIRIERKLEQILFQNLNPFKLGPQGIKLFLISFQGVTCLFTSVAAHPSPTEISQVLAQHHYVVALRSWTGIKNTSGRCDCLHLTLSFYSKIPEAPTISQVLSSHNRSHYTFISKPPQKLSKMVAATPIAPEILDSFIIFLWSGPYNTNARPPFFFLDTLCTAKIKCQIQDKKKSSETSALNWLLSKFKHTPYFLKSKIRT